LRGAPRADSSAPSVAYEFTDGGGELGVIASVTEPFCADCTRARLTADGKLVTCLFSRQGHDLKAFIRDGATDADLEQTIASLWARRRDRYSEERLESLRSVQGYQAKNHRKLEMIVLGG
jgi:GTP 3',8-cyclase